MKKRLQFIALLVASLAGLLFSDHEIVPWIKHIAGYENIQNKDLSILLGHVVFDQLPRVLVCISVWFTGFHFGLMPSIRQALGSGSSWRMVIKSGLIASIILLTLAVSIGAAAGGTFGFHPYYIKMAGDLVSNMYEEIVYRGLIFCSFYGVAATSSFPLSGKLNRVGVFIGTIGSSIIFAIGHEQYSIELRIVIGVVAVIFVYPWIASRSLWAPWIAHMLVDIIGDTIIKL